MNTVIPPSWEVRRHQARQGADRTAGRLFGAAMIVGLTIWGALFYGLLRLVRALL